MAQEGTFDDETGVLRSRADAYIFDDKFCDQFLSREVNDEMIHTNKI